MRSSIQIKSSISDLRDELDAIVAVSEQQNRDLNDEESARASEISEKLIPKETAAYDSAVAIENQRSKRAAERFGSEISARQEESGLSEQSDRSVEGRFAAVRVPAKAKVHGPLKSFQGENAERDAYIAGNVFLAGIFGNRAAQQFCASHGLQVSASMTSNENRTGGFVVPDELSSALIRLREERGVFTQFANRVPMGADIIRVPRLLADVTAFWSGEGLEITASDATLGNAELMARKLGALTRVSSELDEDAVIDIGDMITNSMAYAMADKIDDAAFNGNGESQYGGVLGLNSALHANAIQGALAGNNSALTLDVDDFEAVLARYPQYAGAAPRWFMHSAVYYASAHRLMSVAGGNTNVTLSEGIATPMFLGYPVTFTQVMPSTTGTLASTIVAYFGDLRLGASYGVRRSTRTEVSADRYFELDLIGIKCTERVAINVHERGDTIRNRPIIALRTAS